MVMEVVHEDAGDGSMQCTNHPYKNSTAGGICAFCLQEKLGKLVSSSYPVAVFPSTSSSPSPSFRSAAAAASGGGGATLHLRHLASQSGGSDHCNYHGYYTRKSRLPFVLTHRKKKKKDEAASIVFKRSKSTTTPRRGIHFMDDESYGGNGDDSRRGFWSFLYSSKHSTSKRGDKQLKDVNFTPSVNGNENVISDDASIDRKVSRSRSVGCGSRSFSGDFFERISTGFGDCTLRRVESQREGKAKMEKNGGGHDENGEGDCMKERVKCGGIFSGFMMASLSSSYLIASSEESSNVNGKSLGHGRSKSWGWAFASPMRAFGKNSALKRDTASSSTKKNTTPNLSAIPSLLAVSG